MKAIKTRLSVLNFLEFAVWGSYLVSMGMFLGSVGIGAKIFWFYTVQGLVSLFMPGLVGIIADKWIPAQKMLSLCHAIAGIFMLGAGWYCMDCLAAGNAPQFGPLFTLYTISIAFFMPTIGLNNSVAFNGLNKAGLDTVKDFPPIRTMGTVGFILAELMVNFISVDSYVMLADGSVVEQAITLQKSYTQFFLSGGFSILLMFYALTMPKCPLNKGQAKSLAQSLGLDAFKLFKDHRMAIFFIFSMLLGISLQLTNTYGTTFINQFNEAGYTDWFSKNPTFLISISQCAEAVCILFVGICLKRFGIKGVMMMAMFAWVLRFGFFGIGSTEGLSVIWLILSCIVYGVAFDFFNVAGGLYVDTQVNHSMRSSAQGLFMMMTNGLGASLGTFIAGTYVVNPLVEAEGLTATQKLAGFHEAWLIFAGYALVVFILFCLIFKAPKDKQTAQPVSATADNQNPGGETEI